MTDHHHIPHPQLTYGRIVYWLTVVACVICIVGPLLSLIRPEQNFLNPYFLFAQIFDGAAPQEIWETTGGYFPGGHFYLRYPLGGDAFTHFGLAAVGCSSAAWALLASAVQYWRARDRLFAGMSVFVALLIVLAMSGLLHP